MKTAQRICLVIACIALTFSATWASASGFRGGTIAVSSTVDESGFHGDQNAASYPLTATPYDFTGQFSLYLSHIDSITVTLTIEDGNSALGEFDFGSLTLGLDGIDTGLHLDGFSGGNIQTFTLQGPTPALQSALITALADNQLNGSVFDSTPGNGPAGNMIGLPFRVQTTLDMLVDVSVTPPPPPPATPLPVAFFTAPLGVSAAAFWAKRIRRHW